MSNLQFEMYSDVSESSYPSVIYISSDSEDSVDDYWGSNWSDGEVERLAVQFETQLSSPMLMAGRCGVSDEVCQLLPANRPSASTCENLVTPTLAKKNVQWQTMLHKKGMLN